ncbi:hypothetical protein M1446_05490 [Candidatus Dependentiae bacterium]|nr:hypothetical protein [Candidatus Dependentiae bacterium]
MIQSLKQGIWNKAKNVKVFEGTNQDLIPHDIVTLAIAYDNNGRREVLFAKYLSGPYDCSGFQYTIVLKDKLTEEEALKQLKEFAGKQTSVIKF